MPGVILIGILVLIVVLKLARGGVKRSPVATQLRTVWIVFVLCLLLFIILFGKKESRHSAQQKAGPGAATAADARH